MYLNKGDSPVTLTFFETKNGQIDYSDVKEEGYYLSKAFTAFQTDSIHNCEAFFDAATAKVLFPSSFANKCVFRL